MFRQALSQAKRLSSVRVGSIRNFSEAAQEVPLPINLYGLPARYANALYRTAVRSGTITAVESDLQGFKDIMQSNDSLRTYLANPVISRVDKVADMEKVCAGMSETTRGFVGVLAENGRLSDLEKIVDTFGQLMGAHRQEVEATVISATPLPKKALKKVVSQITKDYVEAGKSVKVTEKVDPSILGGLQIQIGDRFLDLSIQAKINKLHHVLSDS